MTFSFGQVQLGTREKRSRSNLNCSLPSVFSIKHPNTKTWKSRRRVDKIKFVSRSRDFFCRYKHCQLLFTLNLSRDTTNKDLLLDAIWMSFNVLDDLIIHFTSTTTKPQPNRMTCQNTSSVYLWVGHGKRKSNVSKQTFSFYSNKSSIKIEILPSAKQKLEWTGNEQESSFKVTRFDWFLLIRLFGISLRRDWTLFSFHWYYPWLPQWIDTPQIKRNGEWKTFIKVFTTFVVTARNQVTRRKTHPKYRQSSSRTTKWMRTFLLLLLFRTRIILLLVTFHEKRVEEANFDFLHILIFVVFLFSLNFFFLLKQMSTKEEIDCREYDD